LTERQEAAAVSRRSLRLIFMGTPDFAVPALAALLAAGHEIKAVYCQPPRAAGRGHKVRLSPVHAFAEGRGLAVFTPASLKSTSEQDAFAAHHAEAAVVAAYGLILPKAIVDAPALGCVNIHASLLPRWRGAAPIQRAILAGDRETGVSIMQVTEGLDAGPVLAQKSVPILGDATYGALHDTLADLGAEMICAVLERLAAGKAQLRAEPQPDAGVTYAAKISAADARIDWTRPAAEVERHIRAFSPAPGAWFEWNGERIKVLRAEVAPGVLGGVLGGDPGTVVDENLSVACGVGTLRILKAQRPGKGPMETADFLRGYPLPPGSRLK